MDELSGAEIIRNLDLAADVFLNSSSNDQDRKSAEQYFLNLRGSKLSFELSRYILENSTKEFVLFQIVSTLKETIIREWPFIDQEAISGICQYLLRFVARPGLSNFVVAEILQTIAMIVKRGTFDKKSGDTNQLFDLAAQWIGSGDSNLQSLACRLLLSVCNEYCTSWRSSSAGLTWDFHVRAKRTFEAVDLLRVFELCLQVLNHLLNNGGGGDAGAYSVLTARLLYVTESVLNWNFGSRLLPKRITSAIEFLPAICFKPGETWRELLLEADVVSFFFQLFAKVKNNQELAHHVMQCLIQLASLMGSVFADENSKAPYLQRFVACVTEMMQGGDQFIQPVALSQILSKLSSFFATNLFLALPENLLREFLSSAAIITCKYGVEAVKESVDDCESIHEDAYEKLLGVWTNFLDGAGNAEYFEAPCMEIFTSYVRSHVAPPSGNRPLVIAVDQHEVTEIVEDDRDKYADVLKNVGYIGRRNVGAASSLLYGLLKDRIDAFCQYMTQLNVQPSSVDTAALATYQEDMHWLLLVAGSVLVVGDGHGKIPAGIYEFSAHNGDNNLDFNALDRYVNACVLTPAEEISLPEVENNHVIKLLCITLRWASVESMAFHDSRASEFLSPQVAQTTLWCLRRLITAYNAKSVDAEFKQTPLSKLLEAGIPSRTLTAFILEKALRVLTRWSGEAQLSKDAVALLSALVDNQRRSNEMTDGSILFSELHKVNVQQLSPVARSGLLKFIVSIGSSTELRTVQEGICSTILEPLAGNFRNLLQNPEFSTSLYAKESIQTTLLDLFDCFSGIAQSTTSQTAQTLFAYMTPVLDASPNLLCIFKNHQPLIDAVLQFYVDVTRRVAVFLEQKESCAKLQSCLSAILNAYSINNTGKYTANNTVLEEDKMSDLLLLLQILTNVLSKDIAVPIRATEDAESFSSTVSFGLDIVTPLMTNELLKYPSLCVQYYKVVAYLCEMYPKTACQMKEKTLESALTLLMRGLTGEFGNEVLKLSLDSVNGLATFLAQSTSDIDHPLVRGCLWRFVRPVFECCLNTSSEVDLLNDSSTTLYSLICCAQVQYNAMVQELISAHRDPGVQEKLTDAFRALLPGEMMGQPLRREKRSFRDRFEMFLNEVQGLLCLE